MRTVGVVATVASAAVLGGSPWGASAAQLTDSSCAADNAGWTPATSPSNTLATATMSPPTTPLVVDSLFPQFLTVKDVPDTYFDQEKSIFGFCERVMDGDTIRVRHCPGYGWGRGCASSSSEGADKKKKKRALSEETLSIRIYGVDTPEVAKNSQQTSQPFGEQAKQFTTDLVLDRMVKITFLRKDQYGRAVAAVETLPPLGRFMAWIPGLGPKDVSVELAKAGLAELYTGGGAEYHGNRALLTAKITEAQKQKRGIWSQGEGRVSAAQFKKQQKQQQQGLAAVPY